jgi:hypothetical protein
VSEWAYGSGSLIATCAVIVVAILIVVIGLVDFELLSVSRR